MIKVLILCAGTSSRWNNYMNVPKQLIKIDNETLLDRMIRLLHKNNITDINIVSNVKSHKTNNCGFFRPPKSGWILETFLSTQKIWTDRNIILLGDVYYSSCALKTVVKYEGDIAAFGRSGSSKFTEFIRPEIFAISFNQKIASTVILNAKNALNDAIKGGEGKLWQFYRSIAGFSLDEHQIETKFFHVIDDLTNDFDLPEDYNSFIRVKKQVSKISAAE